MSLESLSVLLHVKMRNTNRYYYYYYYFHLSQQDSYLDRNIILA
jgi:hypothetical protein